MTAPVLAPPPPLGAVPGVRPPTVSVVIAAYQAADTLAAAIESALGQQPAPGEVVVVDDGSSDGTAAVAGSFGSAVRLLRLPHGGEARTKNAGARAARGEVVAYLDADDVLLPGWLAAVTDVMTERPDIDLVTTDAWVVSNRRRLRQVYQPGFAFVVDDQPAALLRRNFVLGLCAVRRQALLASGGFDEAVTIASDWSAWLRLVLDGGRLACVARPLAEYRLQETSLSADPARLLRGRVDVLERIAGHRGLDPRLTGVLAASVGEQRRSLALVEARRRLQEATPGARRAALHIALDRSHGRLTRAKAAASVVAPVRLSRRLLARGDVSGGFRAGGATSGPDASTPH